MSFFVGKTLINQEGHQLQADEVLADKDVVLLYLSASWCGPCQAFTPRLKTLYEELCNEGAKIAVIFCSCDSDEDEMMGYFAEHGNYFAIPFGDEFAEEVQEEFGEDGIPHLGVINPENGSEIHGVCDEDMYSKTSMECFQLWKQLADDAKNN